MSDVKSIEPLPFIDGIVYGEGPRWHNGRLWFSDGPAGRVCSVGVAGDLVVEAEIAHASGLGWLPDGTLVVSTMFDAKIHRVDRAGTVGTQDVSDVAWSTNDLVVAPDGRTYMDLYRRTARGVTGEMVSSARTVPCGSWRPGSPCPTDSASCPTGRP